MAKSKERKREVVEEYQARLNEASAFFVIKPTAITPNEATVLRKKLKAARATFSVVKNTLFDVALDKANKKDVNLDISGENAIIFCEDDVSEPAKAVYEFLKEIEKGEIRGGFLNDSPLSGQDVEDLAKLPSKEVLLAYTVSAIGAPISGFVNVMNANLVNLVNVFKNISENKSE